MGRSLRIIDRDVVYHAVTKGNNGGPIACDATDRASVFHELDRAATRYGWEVFAWCCLTTHNHVVLRAPQGGLSEGFREMNGNHSRRTGRRHGWSGHLIRNRFFSVAVESEAHFVGCALYVARNPIAAGLCKRAGECSDQLRQWLSDLRTDLAIDSDRCLESLMGRKVIRVGRRRQ